MILLLKGSSKNNIQKVKNLNLNCKRFRETLGILVFTDLTKFTSFKIYHSFTEHFDKIFTMLCHFGVFVKHFKTL